MFNHAILEPVWSADIDGPLPSRILCRATDRHAADAHQLKFPFLGMSEEPARYAVNTPFPANVYDSVGILRAWPGTEIEVTCSRQA
jgi:hypothetical protein